MTVKELINKLSEFPIHQSVRILDENTNETIGIDEILQDWDTDDKLVVIIKPHRVI